MGIFKKDLENLLNYHSIDNYCNIPDYKLADVIIAFIETIKDPEHKGADWRWCTEILTKGVQ